MKHRDSVKSRLLELRILQKVLHFVYPFTFVQSKISYKCNTVTFLKILKFPQIIIITIIIKINFISGRIKERRTMKRISIGNLAKSFGQIIIDRSIVWYLTVYFFTIYIATVSFHFLLSRGFIKPLIPHVTKNRFERDESSRKWALIGRKKERKISRQFHRRVIFMIEWTGF